MKLARFEGCWTAMITPFTRKGEVDFEGLEKNIQFQIENRAHLVPTGTTGESPTLDWREHDRVIGRTAKLAKDRAFVMAGTGSNSTKEAIRGTKHAVEVGAQSVLMMDCYYNGPSTLELRTQYYEPIAKMFRKTFVVPYIIPGRTGTKMEVEDLAILHRYFKNVRSVKEATADLDRMAKTRSLCGEDFDILSGDDDKTFDMIARRDIRASGVISVMSNIIPGPVDEMVKAILDGNMARANELKNVLDPLFKVVTVNTIESYEGFEVPCKFRNPLAVKTMMKGLGMPSGPCRRPLGKMTPKGMDVVRNALKKAYEMDREVLMPIQKFYKVNIEERLSDDRYWK
ncbi:MAG: 4-hydroxy-tetrahydrodipicolinate synthase [Deltaproteobacteria bacterium RBG_13_53_10]|nr:MAG: 4-hydroxy-tetrahydrodipicolinate synthase [Deltaproteobacteria bacterium RBG_13_53_10]